MGICKVLAIIPFLCSAPADEQGDQESIEAQPVPEVEVTTLTPPPTPGSPEVVQEPTPEPVPVSEFVLPPAPSVRPVSEYEVLPPSSTTATAEAPTEAGPLPGQGADNFSEWVSQNWGEDEAEGD